MPRLPPSALTPGLALHLGEHQRRPLAHLLRLASGSGEAPWSVIGRWLDQEPPFGARFVKGEQASLAAGSGRTRITGYQIPVGNYGLVAFIANGIQNAADSLNVTFALERDGTPLLGFARIIGPIVPTITLPLRVMIPLLPGQVIAWVATNTGTTTVAGVAGFLRGWYWPISDGG